MELFAGVLEFVALLAATRRWHFWLLMAVVVAGLVGMVANLMEPGRPSF